MKNLVFVSILILFNANFSAQKSPKIVVGIVVDQMCYEYLYRFQDNFSVGGFNRFLKNGTNCRNVNYNYVPTYTGPGHASIYTGTTPSNHGIVGNEWFQLSENKVVNCIEDKAVQTVGSTSHDGEASPHRLKTYTITDQLKMTYPEAKVVSVSIKDRGAILPGGHLSNGSYWYDYTDGIFITSSFYKNALPDWLTAFNKVNNCATYTKTWDLLLPESKYKSKDESKYEVILTGKTTPTFPYNFIEMAGGKPSPKLFVYSPFANTLLTDLALTAVKNEQLGMDKQTDMLCISYSTPDIVGHAFGPYSKEVEDIYYRLDRDLERLLSSLEKQFGKDGFTVFLTADHAVVPVPQQLVDNKLPGGYVFLQEKMKALRELSQSKFGADLISSEENLNIYLNRSRIDSLKLDIHQVARILAEPIRNWEGVKAVFTAEDLLFNTAADNEWKDMLRKGFELHRSGSILFILEPGYLPKETDNPKAHLGTSHGSSFNYDTHVPLLWYGAGIPSVDIFRPLQIVDIAPTLTHILKLQRSGAMTGNPIVEILKSDRK